MCSIGFFFFFHRFSTCIKSVFGFCLNLVIYRCRQAMSCVGHNFKAQKYKIFKIGLSMLFVCVLLLGHKQKQKQKQFTNPASSNSTHHSAQAQRTTFTNHHHSLYQLPLQTDRPTKKVLVLAQHETEIHKVKVPLSVSTAYPSIQVLAQYSRFLCSMYYY